MTQSACSGCCATKCLPQNSTGVRNIARTFYAASQQLGNEHAGGDTAAFMKSDLIAHWRSAVARLVKLSLNTKRDLIVLQICSRFEAGPTMPLHD